MEEGYNILCTPRQGGRNCGTPIGVPPLRYPHWGKEAKTARGKIGGCTSYFSEAPTSLDEQLALYEPHPTPDLSEKKESCNLMNNATP